MPRPKIEGSSALVEIYGLVVDARHTCKMPANMINDGLDHMRKSQLAFIQVGNERAAQIMQHPMWHGLLDARCLAGCHDAGV